MADVGCIVDNGALDDYWWDRLRDQGIKMRRFLIPKEAHTPIDTEFRHSLGVAHRSIPDFARKLAIANMVSAVAATRRLAQRHLMLRDDKAEWIAARQLSYILKAAEAPVSSLLPYEALASTWYWRLYKKNAKRGKMGINARVIRRGRLKAHGGIQRARG